MTEEFHTLKIEYTEKDKFKILLINDETIIKSKELTSLDSARIHHILANIEDSLRYEIKFTTEQLSAIEPLLTIVDSDVELYINRLEIYDYHEDDMEVDSFYYPFKSFNDIDLIKNYFAEAQY